MARFNTPRHQTKPAVATVTSPLRTNSGAPDARTYEGAAAWNKDAKTDLFGRLTSSFHGNEKSFYESGKQRDDKLVELVRQLAVSEPQWMLDFATWLRGPGNIRTAALMVAAEFVKARLDAGCTGGSFNRRIIDAVCQRADEPGELLAYWLTTYGRRVPKPVKRGLADAAARLYTERSLLKYDTDAHTVRFADVLDICHPSPLEGKWWQADLFTHALDRRHNNVDEIPESLGMVRANASFRARAAEAPSLVYDSNALNEAGYTWENALALAGDLGVEKRRVWEAMIPNMGIMALTRNLRNFDKEGVSDEVAQHVVGQLTDPVTIANSRMFPFRFLAAYRAASASLRWAYPLEKALNLSLDNVPSLNGRTLILVDRSPSMFPGWGYVGDPKSDISLADQAAVFGAALALRADNPTLIEFGGNSREIIVRKGISVLKLIEEFLQDSGTDIPSAIKKHYAGHNRVIVVTDEQTRPGYFPSNMRMYGGMVETPINDLVPKNIPVYMWALGGYSTSALLTGQDGRFTLGGLTDKAFRMIPQLEAGMTGTWPWETGSA